MDEHHFMKDPSRVFRDFIGMDSRSRDFHRGYEAGVMGMALELITVAKTVEAIPSEDPALPEEVISTIYTLLNGLGLTEQAQLWYERTADWRKPRFVPDEPDASLEHADAAAQLSLLPSPPHDAEPFSPLGEAAQRHTPLVQPGYGQSPGPASELSALLRSGGVPTMPTELWQPPDESGDPAVETRVQHSPRRTGSE
jgi:hypothetical protein